MQAARDLAKKVGVEIKQIYLTTGDSDIVLFVDAPNGDNVAKFALALGSMGNVHTRTRRAWTEAEYMKILRAALIEAAAAHPCCRARRTA